MLKSLSNYRQISTTLHTSAQPSISDFALLQQVGVEIVINLARTDSPNALQNEADIVQQHGMDYIAIPVDFKSPNRAELNVFCDTLQQYVDKIILVHCAYNWRVSCFVYLYRVLRQGYSEHDAKPDLYAVWQPDHIWQNFIEECLAQK